MKNINKYLKEQLMIALSNIGSVETDDEYCKILDLYEKYNDLLDEQDFIDIETGNFVPTCEWYLLKQGIM